jgi:uncharacterized protein YwgA
MNTISWPKYAIIAALAEKLNKAKNAPGRTAMQKFIYLLQEVYNVNCGYDFEFYTYGPFSSEIMSNIDTVRAFGAISVSGEMYNSGAYGYSITPGPNIDKLKNKASEFLTNNQIVITRMIQDFGKCKAEDLELYATIVWVDRDLKSSNLSDENKIKEVVKELKPKFENTTITSYMDILKIKRYIL